MPGEAQDAPAEKRTDPGLRATFPHILPRPHRSGANSAPDPTDLMAAGAGGSFLRERK